MAKNETGIAIVIRAWLPTGKTLDEQLAALTLVKTAHETQDYAALLAAAQIDSVLTDSKTRRVEDEPEKPPADTSVGGEAPPADTDATAIPAENDGRYVDLSAIAAEPSEPGLGITDDHPMSEAIKRERKPKAA